MCVKVKNTWFFILYSHTNPIHSENGKSCEFIIRTHTVRDWVEWVSEWVECYIESHITVNMYTWNTWSSFMIEKLMKLNISHMNDTHISWSEEGGADVYKGNLNSLVFS